MNIIFIGGAFWGPNKSKIIANSIGLIQNAADVLQHNYIEGIASNAAVSEIIVLNAVYIGSYPRKYLHPYYTPAIKEQRIEKLKIIDFSFLNLPGIKHISRFNIIFIALLKLLKTKKHSDVIVICYAMHLPFLAAIYLNKLLNKNIRTCLIVPDLPEFMATRSGIKKIPYVISAKIGYAIANKFTYIAVITSGMLEKFNKVKNSVVIEGIASKKNTSSASIRTTDYGRYFIYSGTLDARYGIIEMLNAFEKSSLGNLKLIICGDGDSREHVIARAKKNTQIIFLGQLDRDEVLELQKKAVALLNPRRDVSLFTKYSFPSKIIEYMNSGRPVLMYKLPGIPVEYYNFCYVIDPSDGGLALAMQKLATTPESKLMATGKSAKEFIERYKTPKYQTNKLINLFKDS